ncbi:hypothetical protein LMG29542_04823 [Paraburkholderia humisilvae]|uniref:Reverse transcriptase domain-containing protein n=1 Tax=Paraburkholderia humisilvae TaxID=627669 RepID=A0A6J5EEZ8_9BURK|nr:hypothetical protein LMG29542_04823 [Paraburkholderia humisilvae]
MQKRIGDAGVIRLICAYLNSGIISDGVVQERGEGTPQGGPLSPLLVNVLLAGSAPSPDLNFPNRPVRTRMPGGMAGARRMVVPYADRFAFNDPIRPVTAVTLIGLLKRRCAQFCHSVVERTSLRVDDSAMKLAQL